MKTEHNFKLAPVVRVQCMILSYESKIPLAYATAETNWSKGITHLWLNDLQA